MIRSEELVRELEVYRDTASTPDITANWKKLCRIRRMYRLRRFAERVTMVIVILFTLSMISPRVRAAVSGWVKSCLSGESNYQSRGEETPEGSGDYMLTWVPEGCMLMGVTNTVNETVYRYVDPEGNNLFFSYIHNMENGSATSWLDAGTEQLQTVTVNGRTSDLFIDADNYAALVWLSEDEGTLFRLQGYFEPEIMLQIAESVVETG